MAICGNWLGFTRFPHERLYIIFVVCTVFTSNFVLSLLPCYADEKYEKARILVNIATISLTFVLSLSWYFFFANTEEVHLFFGPLMLSFLWAFLGFLFYHFKFPECFFTEEKYGPKIAYFSQIYCQSHTLWHIFVVANSHTLYGLLLRACIYYEKLRKN